ncbi:hypothetical protein CFB89_18925 [Burkholderia sp. AU16741]|nr:hypothetical protein CFB89_18925 [Burkholderia sp. AU16741]
MKSRRYEERPLGMELFDVKPVIVGGNPNDISNKVWLTRRQHIEAVRYWNRIVRELKERS